MKITLSSQIRINDQEKVEREFKLTNESKLKSFYVEIKPNMPRIMETDLISGEFKPGEEETVKVRCDVHSEMGKVPSVRVEFKSSGASEVEEYANLKLLNKTDFRKIKLHFLKKQITSSLEESDFLQSQRDVLLETTGSHVKLFRKSGNSRTSQKEMISNVDEISLGLEQSISEIAVNSKGDNNFKIMSNSSELYLENFNFTKDDKREKVWETNESKREEINGSERITIVKQNEEGHLIVEMGEERDREARKKEHIKKISKFKKKNRKNQKKPKRKSKTPRKKRKAKSTSLVGKNKRKKESESIIQRSEFGLVNQIKSKYDRLQKAYKSGLSEDWASRQFSKMSQTLRRARTNQEILKEKKHIYKTYTRRSANITRSKPKNRKKKGEIIERLYTKSNLRSMYAYAVQNQWYNLNNEFQCFACYEGSKKKYTKILSSKKTNICVECNSKISDSTMTKTSPFGSKQDWLTPKKTEISKTQKQTDVKTSDYNLTITDTKFPSGTSKQTWKDNTPNFGLGNMKRKEHASDQGHLRHNFKPPFNETTRHKVTLENIRENSNAKNEKNNKKGFLEDLNFSLERNGFNYFEKGTVTKFNALQIGTFGDHALPGKIGFGKFDDNHFDKSTNIGGNNFSFKSEH
jgi:hypothetical protein